MFGKILPGKRDTRNLLAWYKLQNDAKDYSGNGYHLTTNGTVPYTTVNGIQCAGPFSVANYFSAPQALMNAMVAATTAICIEFSYYTSDGSVDNWLFAANCNSDEWGCLDQGIGGAFFWRHVGPGLWQIARPADNTWNNMAFNGFGTTLQINQNGLVAPGTEALIPGTWQFQAPVSVFNIGVHSTMVSPLQGYLHDIKIWNINQLADIPTIL